MGVEPQEGICHGIADRRGLVMGSAHVFVDNSRSARSCKRQRPGWDHLVLEESRSRGIRYVIACRPDRLMRRSRDLEELLQASDDQARDFRRWEFRRRVGIKGAGIVQSLAEENR
ncbi:recombinase family protein [Streptomyces violarus]|uniref:recombinase family protein n=1 Tax=Streptomyces violarus TaxID=67380 RepID=UPI0037038EB8